MRTVAAVSIAVAALASSLAAQEVKLCSLLTPADIKTAIGAEALAGQEGSFGGKGASARTCMWSVPSAMGGLTLGVGPLPPGTTAAAITKKNPGMDALRKQKWTEESKDFPKAWCSIMSSPATDKEPMSMTTCAGDTKGQIVSLTFLGPGKKITIDQMKSLLDKALARYP